MSCSRSSRATKPGERWFIRGGSTCARGGDWNNSNITIHEVNRPHVVCPFSAVIAGIPTDQSSLGLSEIGETRLGLGVQRQGGASHLEDPDRHVAAEPRLPLQEERARLFHAQRVRPPVVEAEAAEVLPGSRTSQRGAAAPPVRAGTRAGKRQTLSILPMVFWEESLREPTLWNEG
jgi:hypothetical protein